MNDTPEKKKIPQVVVPVQVNPQCRLIGDNNQWTLQTRSKSLGNVWHNRSFIASNKNTLLRVLHEAGIIPDDAGSAALKYQLPDSHREWLALPGTREKVQDLKN